MYNMNYGIRYQEDMAFIIKIVSSGIRNYVERFIETIKDKTRAFDNYFPIKRWMGHFYTYSLCIFIISGHGFLNKRDLF